MLHEFITTCINLSNLLNFPLYFSLFVLKSSPFLWLFDVKEEVSIYRKYLAQFQEPLILMLLASAFLSILMAQYDDAFSITVAIVIVVTVGFYQEYRSEQTLKELNKLVPPECKVLRESQINKCLARYLVPGDIVLLDTGDRVPADIRLLESVNLTIDESSFTGETSPSEKYSHKMDSSAFGNGTKKPDISDRRNIAFMGTLVRAGKGRGIVINTGEKSEFGNIFMMMQEEEAPKTPLQKNMDTLGKNLSVVSLAVIVVIGLIGWIQGKPFWDTVNIAISLAVAAIPEGLPIVVTVTLALGVMRMSKRKAIVRKLPTVETLGSVNVLCTDKTGTLTQNIMTASDFYASNSDTAYLNQNSYNNSRSFVLNSSGAPMNPNDKNILKDSSIEFYNLIKTSVLCNNASFSNDANTFTGSPMESAIMNVADLVGMSNERSDYVRMEEIPFSSEHKWMAVKCKNIKLPKTASENEKQALYYVKGAPEVVLNRCTTYQRGEDTEIPIKIKRDNFELEAKVLAKKGLRVLAFASGDKLNNLCFHGFVGFIDPPRPGIIGTIKKLKEYGIEIKMVTGDSKETAEAVAVSLGLTNQCVSLSGRRVEERYI